MKISKILAGMSALAIAAATAIPAFAEKTFIDEVGLDYVTADGNMVKVSLGASPYDPTTVTAVKLTFNVDDTEGFGGGIMLNSNKSGWDQRDGEWDWGDPNSEKNFLAEGSDGSYTLIFTFDAKDAEYWGTPSDEQYWAEVCFQSWWGADITLTGVEITGDEKSEDASSAADVESSAADTESSKAEESSNSEASSTADSSSSSKAATTNNNNTKNTTTGTTAASSAAAASDNTNQATGATAGLALAGLALAGAVAVVSKRK
ncbi:NPXTG-anchored protein [Ruminococcus albus]|uniref:LPXTG-motif cell wall anchor domain-containing protein n=1 Tax=Ruminococcus albus TaxID=1264 RepID=A0A1I1FVH0_RUMAL|nr:NPXTG-anchored protein [Ruminococcus albus]SFC03315.1 hypothetical protein SAMN02910406_01030 [Ruminococcus albus]